ncbi:MAG: hypothetical protein H0U75_11105 [Legionella sp.]|nr:hypothetical protein [Legionella sp.]
MNYEINPMQRGNYPFMHSPRCGAKTRQARECRSPAVKNKKHWNAWGR